MLLPPDLRDWIPDDHLAHFVVEAVEEMDLSRVKTNGRGTGSEQYPPRMMLSLLIYCFAAGIFSSRQIELATHENVAVRFIAGNTHPDHDTICTFRRENKALLEGSFVKVLGLAAELKVLKVGQVTVSVDGTKVAANASKHAAVSYARAGESVARMDVGLRGLPYEAVAPSGGGLKMRAEETFFSARKRQSGQMSLVRLPAMTRSRNNIYARPLWFPGYPRIPGR
jgi:transposase